MKKGAAVDSKKKNTKEEEAERLEQERLIADQKKKEDEEKYGINELIPSAENPTPMILTEYYCKTAWEHDDPREFTNEFLTEQFTRIGIWNSITDDELLMYSNYIIKNLVFAVKDLSLDYLATSKIVNLMFSIMINKDLRFEEADYPYLSKMKAMEAQLEAQQDSKTQKKDAKKSEEPTNEEDEDEEEDALSRSMIEVGDSLAIKSYSDDLSTFRVRLKQLTSAFPDLLTSSSIPLLASHALSLYFTNHSLYLCYQTLPRATSSLYITISIDTPSLAGPLSDSKHVGALGSPVGQSSAGVARPPSPLAALAPVSAPPSPPLSPTTLSLISRRVQATREYMLARLSDKRANYEEKMNAGGVAALKMKKKK